MFPPDAHCLSAGRACAWSSRQLSIFFPSLTQAALASSQTCQCLTRIWCSALDPSHLPASLLAFSEWNPAFKGFFLSFTGKRCSTWGSLCPTVPPGRTPLSDSIWGKAGMAALGGFVSWQKKPSVGFNWTVCGFAPLGTTAESSPGSHRLPVVFRVKYE